MVARNARRMFFSVIVVSALFVGIVCVSAWAQADVPISFQFRLEVGGQIIGYFSEVSSIGSQNEVILQKTAGRRGEKVVTKMPGDVVFLDVTLKRGIIVNDLSIWNWRQQVVDGQIDQARKDFSIILLNESFAPIAQWNFLRGWPIKIEASSAPPDGIQIPIETLVITHEGVVRVPIGTPAPG